jgi:hypothetical protein
MKGIKTVGPSDEQLHASLHAFLHQGVLAEEERADEDTIRKELAQITGNTPPPASVTPPPASSEAPSQPAGEHAILVWCSDRQDEDSERNRTTGAGQNAASSRLRMQQVLFALMLAVAAAAGALAAAMAATSSLPAALVVSAAVFGACFRLTLTQMSSRE